MDCVMMQYSLLDRRPEEEALDLLHENGISVITRGTLAKGMLIDKPAEDYLGYSADQIQQMKAALDKTGHPLAGAIKYVQQHPAVASVVAGMRTEEQLQELTEANAINLSEEEIANLGNTLSANTYTKHR